MSDARATRTSPVDMQRMARALVEPLRARRREKCPRDEGPACTRACPRQCHGEERVTRTCKNTDDLTGERNASAMKGQHPLVLIGGNVTVRSAPRALVKMQTAHWRPPANYAAVTPVTTSKMVSSLNFSPMEHGLNVPTQCTVLRLTDMYVLTRKSDATSSALSFVSSRLISRPYFGTRWAARRILSTLMILALARPARVERETRSRPINASFRPSGVYHSTYASR